MKGNGWTWLNPPPVVVIYGGMDFLRVREKKKALAAAEKSGRALEVILGEDHDELSSTLSSSGVFFKEKTFVLVEQPEKVNFEHLKAHHERGDNSTCVLLYQEGSIKAKSPLGKLLKVLPKEVVAEFVEPKPWELEEQAAHFVVQEAASKKFRMSPALATAMTQNIGTDFGVLSFEVDKIARLMAARSEGPEVQPSHVKETMAGFSELGPMPIVEALGKRDRNLLSRALLNMRRTHAGAASSAALKACALLGHNVSTWLHVSALLNKGVGLDEIASQIKLHAFVVRKNILPVARRWTEESLVALLRGLAKVERSVKLGHVSSWVQLECVLFHALDGDERE